MYVLVRYTCTYAWRQQHTNSNSHIVCLSLLMNWVMITALKDIRYQERIPIKNKGTIQHLLPEYSTILQKREQGERKVRKKGARREGRICLSCRHDMSPLYISSRSLPGLHDVFSIAVTSNYCYYYHYSRPNTIQPLSFQSLLPIVLCFVFLLLSKLLVPPVPPSSTNRVSIYQSLQEHFEVFYLQF